MAAAGDAGRAGDSVANATHDLYRQYGKQIYAYCLHQLRSREEAEDAVQTTFLNAFRGLQRGTTTRFEQAWLYKIAQNVCIARRSSSGRRLRLETPDDFEILDEIVPSATGSAETLELMGLEDALEQMPENQRRAILLREWQGLSYREIASELDLSQGAVEMLIFRARKTLALALEEPEAAKRRTGKAKTGFSFGSLVAAMKGLFSTGAALKMAAVAVTAAVVGTNAVHSVVHRMTTQRHTRAAVAPQARQASAPPTVVPKESVQLVSWKASRMKVVTAGGGGAASATSTVLGLSGPKPIVVLDASAPQPAAPAAANTPAPSASATGGSGAVTVVAPVAPATVRVTSGTSPSTPPPPPPPQGGSGTSGGSAGQGSASSSGQGSSSSGGTGSGNSGGNGHHQGHGGGDAGGSSSTSGGAGGAGGTQSTTGGTDTGRKGAGHQDQGGGKPAGTTDTPLTDTTAAPTTTATTMTMTPASTTPTTGTTTTTTATTTTMTPDSSSSSANSGTTTQPTTTTTATTTTTLTTTTTPADGGGHGHGNDHGGGGSGSGGGGGNANGGGGGGGGGHHHGGG